MLAYHKNNSFSEFYKLEDELGRGSFAVVHRGVHKDTGERVAIKIFDKTSLDEDDEIALQSEVDILSQLDHPNAVKLVEIFDEQNAIYLVLELLAGGELFDRIVEKESYSEKEASDTVRPIVDAIRYCHGMGIVHRDLKPENLLYESEDENSVIKITDFGLARFVLNELATTACGTPNYVAPEIIQGQGYGKEVDYWSIGVIIYIMLCGFPPFYDENNQTLFTLIKQGTFEFPSPYWDDISDLAKDLISKLLIVNPSQRLDADGIMGHPWIRGEGTPREEMPHVLTNIKKFNARRRLKKAGTAIIGSIRWRKLAQASKSNVPQSTVNINEGAQASMAEASPQQNNFMLAANSEGDSVTPQHDASLHIQHNHGFNESTKELDMRSEESKDYAP